MGTRSLTVVRDNWWAQLLEFLRGKKIVNGLNFQKGTNVANGMPCLAAQIISHFKEKPGGCYVYASGSRDRGEAYIYELYCGPLRKEPYKIGEPGTYEVRDIYLKLEENYGLEGGVRGRLRNRITTQRGRYQKGDPSSRLWERQWSYHRHCSFCG